MSTSSHANTVDLDVDPVPPVDDDGRRACGDCQVEGTRWVHLRLCTSCGHLGCCDSSPRRHASAHARASSHPVAQSFEPGEDWLWCYKNASRTTGFRHPPAHGSREEPRRPRQPRRWRWGC